MEARNVNRIPNYRLRDWVEPAHPAIIRLHDQLLELYQILRERLQQQVDEAFNQASRRIGFVVATTIPVVMEFEQNELRSVRMGTEYLQGTIFEKALLPLAKKWGQSGTELGLDGTYKVSLLWHEALKLRLRTDWMEPAHYLPRGGGLRERIRPEVKEPAHWQGGGGSGISVRPEVLEPAHWFTPGLDIAVEDKVLISVIDEVYPDLRLVQRIGGIRERIRDVIRPEVKEPAHFRPQLQIQELRDMLQRIEKMLEGMG
jgi:hypothetical protein